MKILNIAMSSCYSEGYTYQDNLLPEYQKKLGHEVSILTSTITRGKGGKVVEECEGIKELSNGIKLIRIGVGNKIFQLIGYYPSIETVIRSEAPDLIFVHGISSLVPIQAIAYKKRHFQVTLVADNHQDERNTRVKGVPFAWLMSLWRYCWKKWIPYFSHVYGVTSWRTDFAHNQYGIPKEKLDTLIMGVDNDRLPVDREKVRKEVREKLGLSEDDFVFVSGGKFDARKRIIEAMTAFCSCTMPHIRLVLFGSVAQEIEMQFNQFLNQDKRIKYVGYIPSAEAQRYFMASDFGLFPGSHSVLWEEAAGCGLPCIYSTFTDHDHLQVCGNCIQLAPNSDSYEISKVIAQIVDDENYYNTLRKNATKAAPSFYYSEIAKKSIEL